MLLTVVPAYGVDYSTEEEVVEALVAGKDFKIMDISNRWDGKPMSIRNAGSLVETGYTGLKIRFNRHEELCVVNFKFTGPGGPVFVYHTGKLLGEVDDSRFTPAKGT